jgi:hypothetical protein
MGRTWNFSGSIKNMTECVAHLKKSTTDEKFTCAALKTLNDSELARQNKNESVKNISSNCDVANKKEEAERFEKLMTGVFMKFYKVLEGKFDC